MSREVIVGVGVTLAAVLVPVVVARIARPAARAGGAWTPSLARQGSTARGGGSILVGRRRPTSPTRRPNVCPQGWLPFALTTHPTACTREGLN